METSPIAPNFQNACYLCYLYIYFNIYNLYTSTYIGYTPGNKLITLHNNL